MMPKEATENTLLYHPDHPLSRLFKKGEEIPEGWVAEVKPKKVTKKKVSR